MIFYMRKKQVIFCTIKFIVSWYLLKLLYIFVFLNRMEEEYIFRLLVSFKSKNKTTQKKIKKDIQFRIEYNVRNVF